MNKNRIVVVLFVCLSLLQLPHAIGQDKKKAKNKSGKPAFGVEAGLNMATMNVKYDQNDNSYSLKAGARIGAIVDVPVNNNLFIQPGIFFAMNGTKVSYSDVNDTKGDGAVSINTIEIPINIIYKFGDPTGNRFFVGGGPYIGYNLSGKAKEKVTNATYGIDTTETKTYKIGSTNGEDAIKTLDMGIGFNGGYELMNGVFFRARYQMGLVNMSPNSGVTIHTSSFGIQVGYLLGKHPAHKKNKGK